MLKRLGIITVMVMLLVFPVSAAMVSFQLVETGLDQDAATGEYSRLWESGLMSVFFDAGYIVTSGPITRVETVSESYLNGFLEVTLTEAFEGGADYFVLGFITYSNQRGRALPVAIDLRIYDSNSRQQIHRQSFPAGTGRNNGEELQLAQSAGMIVISHIEGR